MKGAISLELTLTKDDIKISLVGVVTFKGGDSEADIGDAIQRVASELYRMAEIDHKLEVSARKT